jgi:hypothetical protein
MNPTLIDEILRGKYDADLAHIAEVIHNRRKQVRYIEAHRIGCTLNGGDRVEITTIRPRYMIGEKGTIVKVNQTRAEVRMDNQCGRFGTSLTIPLTCLRKIS